MYYGAPAQSQSGRYKGTKNALPFIKYLLGTILAAYKDLDERVALVETKLPALEMVRRASKNKIGRFNKQDIRELCLTLSDSSIEGALRKLVADGVLHLNDGRYALLEFKLGSSEIEVGAKHLCEIERLVKEYNEKEQQCKLRLRT